MRRFRLLPTIIFVAAFTVTLKLGSIWQGLGGLVGGLPAAVAEEHGGGGKDAAGTEPGAAADKANGDGAATAGGATSDPAKAPRGERTGKTSAWFDPANVTDAELDILQKLADRRAALDKRSRELDTRERLLQATEKRIDAKIGELRKIRDTIAKLLKQHDKQKDAQMRSVVKIYENMKPRDAARIFEQLDMSILLDVVERMREAKTAPIMANMNPAKAKAMTAALARRRALPKPQRQDRK